MDENNNVRENESGRKCFIITPIGNDNSDIFRRAKGVIESVIKPVLLEYGFIDIKPAYEINVSGMINTQIINRIIDDDLVIANLTDNNPNVMYELCLRHVVAKPIIHICENGTKLPFDIKDNRTIFYTNDMLGVEELKTNMVKFMEEMEYNSECVDNPIYSAYRYGKLLKETQGTESNEILKLLMDIFSKVSEITNKPLRLEKQNSIISEDKDMYTIRQFLRDIRSIENDKIIEVKNDKRAMLVLELVCRLNTSINLLKNISESIGIGEISLQTLLTPDDVERILECISETKGRYN